MRRYKAIFFAFLVGASLSSSLAQDIALERDTFYSGGLHPSLYLHEDGTLFNACFCFAYSYYFGKWSRATDSLYKLTVFDTTETEYCRNFSLDTTFECDSLRIRLIDSLGRGIKANISARFGGWSFNTDSNGYISSGDAHIFREKAWVLIKTDNFPEGFRMRVPAITRCAELKLFSITRFFQYDIC